MISKKKIDQISKSMYKFSLKNGFVDEKSVLKIINQLTNSNIQGISKILKAYKRLIENQISRESAVIETATKLDSKTEKEIMRKTKTRTLKYKINTNLVFGARISHGDWEYDTTLDSKLSQLIK